VRSLLRGRPGPIIGVGFLFMFWGLLTTYALAAIAYGGFFYEVGIVQIVALALTGGIFIAGLALVLFGGFRCCRRTLRSS
jgi:hypothetical protein